LTLTIGSSGRLWRSALAIGLGLFSLCSILDFTDPRDAIGAMASATDGTLAFAALTIAWVHRATSTIERALLPPAAFACLLPLDVRTINAVSGYAIDVRAWLPLAAVSL
jgi:hypothetical protein